MSEYAPDLDKLSPIDPDWFHDPDPVRLARELIGQFLVSEKDGRQTGGRIVETEAYKAPEDKACHAHLNRFTKRTSVMFEEGGRTYVYLCYGIHHLLNIVTGPQGVAHAILIRAVEPLWGLDQQSERRSGRSRREWTNGPGKLTKALDITLADNNSPINQKTSAIHILRNPTSRAKILSAPRVGIDYAEECVDWPWRFLDAESRFVSVPAP